MNIIEKVSINLESSLSKYELDITKQLIKNYEKIPTLTINELAKLTFTSPASIYRVIKKLGFKGYSDLKYKVADDLEKNKIHIFDTEDYYQLIINNIEVTKRLNENLIQDAARMILTAKNKYCFGTGWKQKQIANNFSTDLLYYGEKFITLRTEMDLGIASTKMSNDSLILVVSLGGNGKDYLPFIEKCKLNDGKIIAITNDTPNRLSYLADISLYYKDLNTDNRHWNTLPLQFLCEYLIETIVALKMNS